MVLGKLGELGTDKGQCIKGMSIVLVFVRFQILELGGLGHVIGVCKQDSLCVQKCPVASGFGGHSLGVFGDVGWSVTNFLKASGLPLEKLALK